ncbi:MAG: hypothetical protein M3Q30_02580 [Actinomycetota bacterium]|nr:hypothetical protein [Actinomycetota bacterium]
MTPNPATPNRTTPNSTTNQYGMLAREHMVRWCPNHYTQIPDPDDYFQMLGQEILNEIENLEQTLLQLQHPATTFAEKAGRANMARMMAEERILAERVFLSPEIDPTEPAIDDTSAWIGPSSPTEEWIPLRSNPPDDPTT